MVATFEHDSHISTRPQRFGLLTTRRKGGQSSDIVMYALHLHAHINIVNNASRRCIHDAQETVYYVQIYTGKLVTLVKI